MCVLIHNQDNNMQIIKIFKIFKKSGDKICVFECDRFCFAIICITSSVSLYYYHYCEWWQIVVMKKELRTEPSNYLLSSIAEA